jgi:Lrp/AsnC family leucine-responsive transcriptional regulator
MTLDSIDKNYFFLLQTDSKKTTKELSLKLNLSVTAVYERIKNWSEKGLLRNMLF